jgi:hypothetical protein
MAETLRKAHKEVEVLTFQNARHAPMGKDERDANERSLRFLTEHLSGRCH